MKRIMVLGLMLSMALLLTACGGPPSLAGNWRADDGTGTKVISNSGACSGMYYNRGEPLDIGGPMSCSMGSKKDSRGRYSLVVTQSMNQTTLKLEFDGDDTVVVYDSSGNKLFTMKRQ